MSSSTIESIDSPQIPIECAPETIRKLSTNSLPSTNRNSLAALSDTKPTKENTLTQLSSDLKDEVICPICLRCMHRTTTLVPCLHNFCSSCISRHQFQSTFCPICREPISNFRKNEILDIIIRSIDLDSNVKRTKEECEDLDKDDDLLTFSHGKIFSH